jgi:hypothetical protein
MILRAGSAEAMAAMITQWNILAGLFKVGAR